ncbi:MAG: DUF4148 domain-containing protein [Pseudomonadota bacterium]|uniref:DUF4148 domain-containing protein n=1 Tax=Polaromonas aquatica TaxID=332657 RepID=A0ABW1TZI3_9BURK
MKSKFFAATVVAIAALSGVSAFAQANVQNRLEGEASTRVTFDTSPSKLTRAQVQAEYLQARKNNTLPLSDEASFSPAVAQTSNLTRAEVVAAMGKVHALDGSEKLTQH